MRKITGILKFIYNSIWAKVSPNNYAKKLGVNLGENVKFYGMKAGMFSTEPWLITIGNNCFIKNSIILNNVYIGDNTHIENCIIESRDTIRANSYHKGENGIKIVIEKNERYIL